jgi:transposase
MEVRKRSSGRTELEAMKKAEELQYNYGVKGDTLHIDEYFTSPAGRKWSADNVGINLYMPVGTILKLDKDSKILFHQRFHNENNEYLESRWESRNSCWVLTDEGLEEVNKKSSIRK